MQRAVFLDRDGVINQAVVRDGRPYPPASVDDLVILDGVAEACARLKAAGFLLIVVTNQPDIARGKTPAGGVDEINARLSEVLPLDEIGVCPHDDIDGCVCRKPKPGLLLEAAARRGIDLSRSFMIGDRWRDVEAGQMAGCRTVFLDYGYDERQPTAPDHIAPRLIDSVDYILKTTTN